MNDYMLGTHRCYLHGQEYFQLLSTLQKTKKKLQKSRPYIAVLPAFVFLSHLISST